MNGIVPGGVGLHDDASVAAQPGDVHQGGNNRLPNAPSTIFLARRDTHQLTDPPAVQEERSGADQFPPYAGNHKDIAHSEVVVQNIIQVRVERFVDVANAFGSMDRLLEASEEEINAVPGIGPKIGHSLYSWL